MEDYIENLEKPALAVPGMEDARKPVMLFSNLWHRGELAVLFGNPRSGKSLLAVQVANAISNGTPVDGFELEMPAQKILYLDFDKSGYRFNTLYHGHTFNPNFKRLVVNKKNLDFKHLAGQLFCNIERLICEEGAEVLVFDSLPVLKYFVNDGYLLKSLQRLKEEYGISILLVGETKNEIKGKTLKLNHLDAHKQLTAFADSVFALGHINGEQDGRYLIHLKASEDKTYHCDNVVTGNIRIARTSFDFAQDDSCVRSSHPERSRGECHPERSRRDRNSCNTRNTLFPGILF